LFDDELSLQGPSPFFVRAGDNTVVVNIGQSGEKKSSVVSRAFSCCYVVASLTFSLPADKGGEHDGKGKRH
jgi:hypothetical protein